MKNILNRSTEQLVTTLKRQPSHKTVHLNKVGSTLSSFYADKLDKKHNRTRTDDITKTLSTISTGTDIKFKNVKDKQNEKSKHNRKKVNSEVDLRKVSSHKILDLTLKVKPSSCLKPTINVRQTKNDCAAIKSLQKMRKNINETNPEVFSQQLKGIGQNQLKNPLTVECYLLSNDLLLKMKTMKKKYEGELNLQKQAFQRRQNKLMQKILQLEKKNQRCSILISQLRTQNIDIDTIWHSQGLHQKTM